MSVYSETLKYFTSKECGLGKEPAKATARLAAYCAEELKLTSKEMKRWKELHVMNAKGRVMMQDPSSTMEWLLIGMAWEGLIDRSKEGSA